MDDQIVALDADILHTTDDIAGILRVDVVTVRRLISRGDLAAYRVGNEFRFSRADVEDYLRRQHVPARVVDTPREDPEWGATIELFGRYTSKARQTLIGAREEAMRFNHTYIGTEHLLLGLTYEPESIGVRALARLGVDAPRIHSAVEFIIRHGDRPVSGHIGFTPRAKKALSLATEEARLMNHTYIGTEHLLLGLLREGTGIAAGVLQSLAVNLEMARAQVVAALEGRVLPAPALPIAPPVPAEAAALVAGDQEARACSRCGARCPAYFRCCFNCGHGLPARHEQG